MTTPMKPNRPDPVDSLGDLRRRVRILEAAQSFALNFAWLTTSTIDHSTTQGNWSSFSCLYHYYKINAPVFDTIGVTWSGTTFQLPTGVYLLDFHGAFGLPSPQVSSRLIEVELDGLVGANPFTADDTPSLIPNLLGGSGGSNLVYAHSTQAMNNADETNDFGFHTYQDDQGVLNSSGEEIDCLILRLGDSF